MKTSERKNAKYNSKVCGPWGRGVSWLKTFLDKRNLNNLVHWFILKIPNSSESFFNHVWLDFYKFSINY